MYGHPNKKPTLLAASIAIAACTFSLSSSGEIQLTPAGSFSARDGRPFEVDSWKVTDATAPTVLAVLAARKDQIVIDYDHQTLYTEKNGQPAPAAGWFKGADVVYRSGEGFFVTPDWTAAAKASIDADELKYISPVLRYNKKTGEVVDILMAALTNYAAIDGMQNVKETEALAAAKFEEPTELTQHHEENPMDEKLKLLLGLKPDASDDEVLAALKAVQDKNAEADTAIAAAKAETPPDAMETIKTMQTELAALTAQVNGKEVDDLVDVALAEGRLLPAQEKWARKLGESDMASLKGYLDDAVPVAALKGTQTDGKKPEGTDAETLDDEAMAVCKQMNIDPEDYKKTLQEQA